MSFSSYVNHSTEQSNPSPIAKGENTFLDIFTIYNRTDLHSTSSDNHHYLRPLSCYLFHTPAAHTYTRLAGSTLPRDATLQLRCWKKPLGLPTNPARADQEGYSELLMTVDATLPTRICKVSFS